ncbi:DUF1349 domain-containing protein [Streptomyces sp. NPDC054863]
MSAAATAPDTGWTWSDGRPYTPGADEGQTHPTGADGGRFVVTAEAGADLYRMPGVREIDRLPSLGREVTGDFTLSVRAEVRDTDGGRFADAAGIVLHTDAGWAKFCVERTPSGSWSLVTVVSQPWSDEAAGPALDGPCADLTVVREGQRLAFLYGPGPDAAPRFVRTFTVPDSALRVGLFAQAPFSPSCTAVFDRLRHDPEPLRDRR